MSSKKKTKSKKKAKGISPPKKDTRILCANTDFIPDIRQHPANRKNTIIVYGYCRNFTSRIDCMQDMIQIISEYFICIDENDICGGWSYYKRNEIGDESITWGYSVIIRSNLAFCITLRWCDYEYTSIGPFDDSQVLLLNGNIVIITEKTYLLFFDIASIKQLRNTTASRHHIFNNVELSMVQRRDIYIQRVLNLYKKHKINVKKKYKTEIEELKNSNKVRRNKSRAIEWEHVALKYKEIRIKNIKPAKPPMLTKRKKQRFRENYKDPDPHVIYLKMVEKYEEVPFPGYLGAMMLHFSNKERDKCMLYHNKKSLFKKWLTRK